MGCQSSLATTSREINPLPIYEYRCQACSRKSSVFFRSFSDTESKKVTCEHCSSEDVERVISAVAHHKTLQQIHEESGSPKDRAMPDYYKDPRNIGRWAEERFARYGQEMPEEIRTKIDAAREGSLELNDQP